MRTTTKNWLRATAVLAAGALSAGLVGCATWGSRKAVEEDPYVFFPPPPVAARIQFLCSLNGEADFVDRRADLMTFLVGSEKSHHRSIGKPYGVLMRSQKLYVADTVLASIAVLDFRKEKFTTFGRKGDGRLQKPINVRSGPGGNLFVCDTLRGQVVEFTDSGRYVTAFGPGKDSKPSDVVVTGKELFLLDNKNHQILVYDRATGKQTRTIGSRGKEPGQFSYPAHMTSDSEGNLYVCDMLNFRIQKMDQQGKVLFEFGKPGQTAGFFSRPKGVTVARDGVIYVVDAMLAVVQMFTDEGELLMHFGESGTGDGRLYLPAQITLDYDIPPFFRKYVAPDFDAEYLIYVTNQLGPNKVSVYAFGTRRGQVTESAE